MFEAYDSSSQEIDLNQFVDSLLDEHIQGDQRHCITLIGNDDYGLEVELSGYVSVDREVSEAEAFLARLYEQG